MSRRRQCRGTVTDAASRSLVVVSERVRHHGSESESAATGSSSYNMRGGYEPSGRASLRDSKAAGWDTGTRQPASFEPGCSRTAETAGSAGVVGEQT